MPSAARMRPRAAKIATRYDEEAARGGGVVDEELEGLEVGCGLAGVEVAEGVQDGG